MTWNIVYLPEVEKDLRALDHQQQLMILKALQKIKSNPLPQSEGGYGKPLGHKRSTNLTGLLKVKLRGPGIRIVYKLIKTDTKILVVVIGLREDSSVYEIAQRRSEQHNL